MNLLWHLNFDGEFELASEGGDYHRSPRMAAHCARLTGTLEPIILSWSGSGSRILRSAGPAARDQDTRLIHWIPTAGSAAIATAQQLPVIPHPPVSTVTRANHRSLAARVSRGIPIEFAEDMTQLDNAVRKLRDHGHGVLLKRALGFGGRWQKTVGGAVLGKDRLWAEASMTDYGCGLQVEPRVEVLREWVTHGYLGDSSQLHNGPLTRLLTDDNQRWRGNALESQQSDPAVPELAEQIHSAHAAVVKELRAIGYFGPFGVDHFEYRGLDGNLELRCNSDINARFTMGWFLAMAEFSPTTLLGEDGTGGPAT